MDKIALGGGCHWCIEAIFQMLKGVAEVEQGFVRSDAPADSWAEGVLVHFDGSAIGLATLVEVHLRTHRASSTYRPKSKYRSAIYIRGNVQQRQASETIAALQREWQEPIETKVLHLRAFKRSDARFANYYASNPESVFCRRYIDPKLELIRLNFAGAVVDRHTARQGHG
jgi:peptide-methionine (S)-S-oxide reductase